MSKIPLRTEPRRENHPDRTSRVQKILSSQLIREDEHRPRAPQIPTAETIFRADRYCYYDSIIQYQFNTAPILSPPLAPALFHWEGTTASTSPSPTSNPRDPKKSIPIASTPQNRRQGAPQPRPPSPPGFLERSYICAWMKEGGISTKIIIHSSPLA